MAFEPTTLMKRHLLLCMYQEVLAGSDTKRLTEVTNGTRRILVTGCCILKADDGFLCFLQAAYILNETLPDTLELAKENTWIMSPLFVEVLKHFIQHSNLSTNNRILFIYDNHKSHISPNIIKITKENGITILTLPPHYSDLIQFLNVFIYQSLKSAYHTAADSLM